MNTNTEQPITVRPGHQRGMTRLGWLDSRHSFSFGQYHDPDNMGHRGLRVFNDDTVAPGAGFGEHGHDNMEILTWVLDGALRHGDSLGHHQRLVPGELQAMSAGSGIRHSEQNDSRDEPVRFLQIWLEPDRWDIEPRYHQRAFDPAGRKNRWQTLATGSADRGTLPIQRDVTVQVADLGAEAAVEVAVHAGRHAYVHIATGAVVVYDQYLKDGDAFTAAPGTTITLRAAEPAQVIWFDLD